MPLSAAERCRRYRENLKRNNPEKYEEIKKKNNERTKSKKRKIADMSEYEKHAMRKQWRDAKRNKKEQTKETSAIINIDRQRRTYRSKLLRKNKILEDKNSRLIKTNSSLKKTILRLRNKIHTLTNQLNDFKTEADKKETPIKSPITNFLEEMPDISQKSKEKMRNKLLETRVLEKSLKETYNSTKSFREKNVLKRLVVSESVKKYNMQAKVTKCLGLKRGIRSYRSIKQKRITTAAELKKFFERDDISRMTAGKKEYVARHKIKKQKRFLLNTLSNLYKIYRNEGGVLSFSTFKRYRPFYVVSPHVSNRNTCVCIKHANLAFKAQTLKKSGLISSDNLDDLVSEIVCNTKDKSCMYSECSVCFGKKLVFALAGDFQNVSWFEWTTKTYNYEKTGTRKTTKKTVKIEKSDTLNTLCNLVQEDLTKFKLHHYNIYHQHKQYKESLENIQDNEIIIHCDFSENYSCKMAEEVQSMHFGGSKQQITLHTGVVYVKNKNPVSFCTISPSLKHDPQAIWGHLEPVIDFFKDEFPTINCVHFHSDGPTTQYRQKKNFWLFGEKTKEAGFIQATWSFFEASHGKGAADGVGGAIKRILDNRVSYGDDIVDAYSAFEILSKTETTIKLFYIPEDNIENIQNPLNIQPVPNTMKIHQIIATDNKRVIKYRPLSCFCARGYCDCFSPKIHDFTTDTFQNKDENNSKYKKISKNKVTKFRKRSKEDLDTTSEDTDSNEIRYADSDDDYTPEDEMNSEETVTETQNEQKEKKVRILAEISNTPENRAYFDLKRFSKMSLKNIGLDFDVSSAKESREKRKEVDAYPIPSSTVPEINKELSVFNEDDLEAIQTNDLVDDIKIKDAVLVRYYIRKVWKYFVGFVDKIDHETLIYTVTFLKTIKTPKLKFVLTKKKDIDDNITSLSIVKKIKLSQQIAGEYCLVDDFDYVYFN